ncbi:hypothetical protein [Streptomyces sp. NPDC091278]|uniref:hypothetical protein n=1 Tax=Streptomyces sp. NPDC091278 TaxID=3155301 RepID=UPI00344BCAD9
MNRKQAALAAGAVLAAGLALGGWAGYRHLDDQAGPGSAIRGYDAYSPAGTAPHSEDVFTGRVVAFEGQKEIASWTTDIYRVEVLSVLRGDVEGTVRVTWAPDGEPRQRLSEGAAYVFATQPWQDETTVKDGNVLMFHGEMRPADEAALNTWKAAVRLPLPPE